MTVAVALVANVASLVVMCRIHRDAATLALRACAGMPVDLDDPVVF